MNVLIVGTGYVGLTTGVVLSKLGLNKKFPLKIICIDTIKEKVEQINAGVPPFYEVDLEPLLKKAVQENLLEASANLVEHVDEADVIFICVGTPCLESGSTDLKALKSATEEIGRALKSAKSHPIICVKSTVLPGTTRSRVLPLLESNSGKKGVQDFGLMFIPEFLREGNAIHDNFYPDRIILGEMDEASGQKLETLYKTLLSDVPILRMSIESAELVKYASNAFLAMKVSFANQISRLAERIPGVDVVEVMEAVGLDKRIAPEFFDAGVGFGGSCFPKDVNALVTFTEECEQVPYLLKSTLDVNETQPLHFIELLKSNLTKEFEDLTISILGLAFKPGTSDMRNAASIKILQHLKDLDRIKTIKVHDPVAMENAKKELAELNIEVTFSKTPIECIKQSDACLIVTEWEEYQKIPPEAFLTHMRTPFILDGRRIYDKNAFSSKLTYVAIGLGSL